MLMTLFRQEILAVPSITSMTGSETAMQGGCTGRSLVPRRLDPLDALLYGCRGDSDEKRKDKGNHADHDWRNLAVGKRNITSAESPGDNRGTSRWTHELWRA